MASRDKSVNENFCGHLLEQPEPQRWVHCSMKSCFRVKIDIILPGQMDDETGDGRRMGL